jgi:hypothetical protein
MGASAVCSLVRTDQVGEVSLLSGELALPAQAISAYPLREAHRSKSIRLLGTSRIPGSLLRQTYPEIALLGCPRQPLDRQIRYYSEATRLASPYAQKFWLPSQRTHPILIRDTIQDTQKRHPNRSGVLLSCAGHWPPK